VTFGDPQPTLFHDPRTLERRASRYDGPLFPPVYMHAKCVVVDRRRVLVGSANFARRAQALNIEVGWRRAIASGFVVKM